MQGAWRGSGIWASGLGSVTKQQGLCWSSTTHSPPFHLGYTPTNLGENDNQPRTSGLLGVQLSLSEILQPLPSRLRSCWGGCDGSQGSVVMAPAEPVCALWAADTATELGAGGGSWA